MKRIFFDTEFTDLSVDAELISMGFVSEPGTPLLYVELSDWEVAKANDFVRQFVIPLLGDGAQYLMDAPMCLTTPDCAAAMSQWLMSFDDDLELVSDSAWDWRMLQGLLSNRLNVAGPSTAAIAGSAHSLRGCSQSIACRKLGHEKELPQ